MRLHLRSLTRSLLLFPLLVGCNTGDATASSGSGSSSSRTRPEPSPSPVTSVASGTSTAADAASTSSAAGGTPSVGTFVDQNRVAEGEQAFAARLYGKLPADGNLFFSPTSIRMALGMTYGGAKGETAAEMQKALVLSGTPQQIHDGFAAELRDLTGSDPKQTVHVTNRLWGQQGRTFDAGYLALLERNYGAPLTQLDFKGNPTQSRLTINAAIEDSTEHRIKDLLDARAVTAATKLVLTNAVYFKAAWQEPFEPSATVDAPFYLTGASPRTVRLMSSTQTVRYGTTSDAQIVEVPYASGKMSMMIVLPTKRDGLAALEHGLSDASIGTWAKSLASTKVEVKLPRFTMESELSLKDMLSRLGMPSAFDSRADFSGMDGTRELVIGDVVHKAFIALDEKGTEAAAATAVVMKAGAAMAPAPPPVFRADHPFLFLIRDPHGAIVFMGRMAKP